jgi:hypothetical protein
MGSRRCRVALRCVTVSPSSPYGRHPAKPPAPSLLEEPPNNFISLGVDGARGMSVLSWGDWKLARADVSPITGQVVGAINVTGLADVSLLVVWACLSGGVKVNPVIEAIDRWAEWLAQKPVIATGDFDSGHFWDDKRTVTGGDHHLVVAALGSIGLRPVCCTPGADGPISHWHNNGNGYHIDHVFLPAGWPVTEWSVGSTDPSKG